MSSKASRRRNRRSLQRALRGEPQATTERRTDKRPGSCAVLALDYESRNLYPSAQATFEDRMLRGGFGHVPVKMTGAEYIMRGRTTYREHDKIPFRRDRRDTVPYKRDFYGPKEPKDHRPKRAEIRAEPAEIRAPMSTEDRREFDAANDALAPMPVWINRSE